MKLQLPLKFLLVITAVTTVAISCSRSENIPQKTQINDFVWKGMNAYYKWQSSVPNLADRKQSPREDFNNYLNSFSSPASLFQSLRYRAGEIDRFSWIVDDYVELENAFQGIRLTSGMKLKGADYANGSGDFYVYVYDVVEGSDADAKGITRGMFITEINGTKLTEDNAGALFSNTSFTVHLADYNDGNPVANGTTKNITKTEVQENPVKIVKVLEEGDKKIGYLLYNQFAASYDAELNAAFAELKAAEITDLIVDLRYNGGGSVNSAVYLGSMITGQFENQLYLKQVLNEKIMASEDNNKFNKYFTNRIIKEKNGTILIDETINSINMSTVYFIVSDDTASASELVINSLDPYIDVKLVGTKTVGKHVGSATLYDSDNYMKNGPNFNSWHTWAMQPIIGELQNKKGENKPEGFVPENEIKEDPSNLGVLGEPSEPLLAQTIQYITTGSIALSRTATTSVYSKNWNSNMMYSDYNNMYIELK